MVGKRRAEDKNALNRSMHASAVTAALSELCEPRRVISGVRCFVLKHKARRNLKTEQTRSAFLSKLRVGKRRGELEDASNKSMNVRAKQRLCYERVFLLSAGLVAVSPHVISAVRRFFEKGKWKC